MGELLDRELQRQILNTLSLSYPAFVDTGRTFEGLPENVARVNLFYLGEHDLIEVRTHQTLSGPPTVHAARITAGGLDFLQDDGGLGAVLGVVTVKLADETVKQLLAARVEASDADPGVKERLLETIKGLPSKATEDIAGKLVDWAAAGVSIEMLRAWLGA